MDTLLYGFMQAGLLQFGSFAENGKARPFQFRLEYLPSYPDLLGQLAVAAWQALEGHGLDRLIVPHDALPLGVRVSAESNLPLVWGWAGDNHRIDLFGAYDTGHRAGVVTNTLLDTEPLLAMIQHARRVGLDVPVVFTLIDPGIRESVDGMAVKTLWTMTQLVDELSRGGLLPEGQRQAVLRWIED